MSSEAVGGEQGEPSTEASPQPLPPLSPPQSAASAKTEGPSALAKLGRYLLRHKASGTALVVSICSMVGTCYAGYQARRSVDAQREGLDKQYRPWLAVKSMDPPRFDGSTTDVVTWTITNAGTLAAYGRWEGSSSVREIYAGFPTTSDKMLFPFDAAARSFDLGPGQSATFQTDMRYYANPERLRLVKAEELDAYICIRFRYTGPDRKEAEHALAGCSRYRASDGSWEMFTAPPMPDDRP